MHNAIKKYSIDTNHFTGQGWNTGLKFKPLEEKPIDKILVADSSFQSFKLKRRLLQEGLKKHICEQCGLIEWQGKPIPLELHHINGNNRDNRIKIWYSSAQIATHLLKVTVAETRGTEEGFFRSSIEDENHLLFQLKYLLGGTYENKLFTLFLILRSNTPVSVVRM